MSRTPLLMAGRLASIGILCLLTGLLVGAAPAQTHPTIEQKGIAFRPGNVRIKAGSQVVFKNLDPFGHNVYSPDQGGTFDIGLQVPDASTAVIFREAGTYTIMCRIHPKMRASVTVEP